MNENKLIELIGKQKEMASTLKRLKDEESKIRREICDHLLEGKAAGTHKFNIGDYQVKAVKSFSYSLDQNLVQVMLESGDFSDDEVDAIRTKYELNLANYKNLENSDGLDDCITVKESMPSLTVD